MLDWNKKEAPVLGLLGSGGGLGYLAGGVSGYPADSFWISEAARGSWGNEYTGDIAGDDEGNVYVVAWRYDAGGSGRTGMSVAKHTVDGTVSWQNVQYPSSSGGIGEGTGVIAEASGDHIYLISESSAGACMHKMNKSDGTVDWRRLLGEGNSNDKTTSLVMRSDGNVNCIVRMDTDSGRSAYFNINESNGAYVWQTSVKKTNQNTTRSQTTMHMKVDSSDNIHSLVWATDSNNEYINAIVKHNSSGILQSISDYSSSTNEELDYFADIAVDSLGNKYISYSYNTGSILVGGSWTASPNKVGIMKVNSSDVIQWQKEINSSTENIDPRQIEVMPGDAGIIMRIVDDHGDDKCSFVRFDMSGNVVWKRQFGISGINLVAQDGKMRLNRNGNIIFNTYFNVAGGLKYTVVAQLPSNGSLTGNHTVGSRTYNWSANTTLSFTTHSAWNKTSSIFSSETNSDSNAAQSSITLANNVQTFTKGDVD